MNAVLFNARADYLEGLSDTQLFDRTFALIEMMDWKGSWRQDVHEELDACHLEIRARGLYP